MSEDKIPMVINSIEIQKMIYTFRGKVNER